MIKESNIKFISFILALGQIMEYQYILKGGKQYKIAIFYIYIVLVQVILGHSYPLILKFSVSGRRVWWMCTIVYRR